MDDSALWAKTIREMFFLICDFLTHCSRAGVIFGEAKFQFCQRVIEFVGFMVGDTGIRPTGKMLETITSFPRPRDLTSVRSFFGLIEQVSWAFSKRDEMSPFRSLLKSKQPFLWSEDLQTAFEAAKANIAQQVANGVTTFQVGLRTTMLTDWSKVGIAMALVQKHCGCRAEGTVTCCKDGWRLCYAASRFCSEAESRYSPVEGEALAVAWGCKKAKYFLAGCHDMWVGVDHKPLLGLYAPEKALADIENARLRRLVEKAVEYRFKAFHIPGVRNLIADGLSRAPVGAPEHLQLDAVSVAKVGGALEQAAGRGSAGAAWLALVGAQREQVSEEEARESQALDEDAVEGCQEALESLRGEVLAVRVLTLKEVVKATDMDEELSAVRQAVETGEWPQGLEGYRRVKSSLSVLEGAVLYGDRLVIPPGLRQEVLGTLHAGHQGVSSMQARASHAVWWPGLGPDITRVRERCLQCSRHAPSQPKEPPAKLPEVRYPFQMLCADYFDLKGYGYLVMVDRYSGWPVVHRALKATAQELVKAVTEVCLTFGVPEEIASDGGPQFVSEEFRGFCDSWGIQQRISSAYFPHSNTRAEIGVKTVKRLIRDNLGKDGALGSAAFGRALLEYRNTPDRDTGRSPAQVIFGRQVRDFIPVKPGKYEPRSEWLLSQDQREKALARRHRDKGAELARGTRDQLPLEPGTVVLVQNQVGKSANRWDKSGVIVADKGHSQYQVKLDGSGRVTLRNRAFLKRIVPYKTAEEVVRGTTTPGLERGEYRPGHNEVLREEPAVEPLEVEKDNEVEDNSGEDQVGVSADAQHSLRRSSRTVARPSKYSA